MTKVTVPVSSYAVSLSRELRVDLDGRTGYHYATIRCNSFEGYIYRIHFVAPDSSPLDNYFDPNYKTAATFVPYNLYSMYIDLLRNEGPLEMRLDSEHPEWNQLRSLNEAIGEGE
jgi:hypothetical protein